MLYRTLSRIGIGGGKALERGVLSDLKMLKKTSVDILVKRNKVRPVSAPPLDQLPDWTPDMVEAANKAGITRPDEVLLFTTQQLVKKAGITLELAEAWHISATEWLTVYAVSDNCCGNQVQVR